MQEAFLQQLCKSWPTHLRLFRREDAFVTPKLRGEAAAQVVLLHRDTSGSAKCRAGTTMLLAAGAAGSRNHKENPCQTTRCKAVRRIKT